MFFCQRLCQQTQSRVQHTVSCLEGAITDLRKVSVDFLMKTNRNSSFLIQRYSVRIVAGELSIAAECVALCRIPTRTENNNSSSADPLCLHDCPFTRVYPKVSGLSAWSENCKLYSPLPLGALVSPFYESV
jgi:hypothetical protein